MSYDPDRFDAEIILDRLGYGVYTMDVVAAAVGVPRSCVSQRLRRGYYPRPAIEDANGCGFVPSEGGSRALRHEWSKEQVIDMILKGAPVRPLKPIVHGTMAGFAMERQRGIPHCADCREAENARRRVSA